MLLSLFKFWIVRNEDIYGAATEYDALWFLAAAKRWYWGADYSWLAFARPAAYPLWVALVHAVGLPLRCGTELLQMGGYAALAGVLVRLGMPRTIGVVVYAVCTLHPGSFQMNNLTLADTFYAGLLPLALAGLILIPATRNPVVAVLTGVVLAVLWNTREESILLVGLLACWIITSICHGGLAGDGWRATARRLFVPTAALVGTLVALVVIVYSVNQHTFLAFAKSEMSSRAYLRACKALRRIKPSRDQRFISVSHEALELAYTVSPTFARLQPLLEGELGHDWAYETYTSHQISGEIAAGWFHWAFRNAASVAGMHATPATAKKFYSNVAREINDACDKGRLPKRFASPFADPSALVGMPHLPASFQKIAGLFVLRYERNFRRDDFNLRDDQRVLYGEMTGRRPLAPVPGTIQVIGWAFQFDDPVIQVAWRDAGGVTKAATADLRPRPDVIQHFAPRTGVPLNTHFVLPPVDLEDTTAPVIGELVFTTGSGSEYRGSAAAVFSGQAPKASGSSGIPPLMTFIDSHTVTPRATDSFLAVEGFLGTYHRVFVAMLSIAGAASCIALVTIRCGRTLASPLFPALILLAVVIGSRVALFTYLDATSWPCEQERYLFPVTPLYSVALIILLWLSSRCARAARSRSGVL